ncbi:MAG: hypothetical protein K0B10_10105 [Vicingaceae bacterium]|nr:hypothetical protein [Vicingaceae bacterium]
MKKIIILLIILIAFCELKAQNKHYEFTVVKPESDINVILDTDYMIVKENYAAQFTQTDKNRKYRFSFTHGTIEQKDKLIYIFPNKTGEGSIIIYEVVGKDNVLVKEIIIDIYNEPMYYLGDIKLNPLAKNNIINDLAAFNEPLVLTLKNETKELVFPLEEFKVSKVCGNGNRIIEIKNKGKFLSDEIKNKLIKSADCNSGKLYVESIFYKNESGMLKKSMPFQINF